MALENFVIGVIGLITSVSAGGLHYCYECSSKSALCRDTVYDGNYLSKTLCSSACFLRYEGDTVYRGCFDGWRGGLVNSDYEGCALQNYLGEQVEWCFCKGEGKEPCNGANRAIIMLEKYQKPEVTTTALPTTPEANKKYEYIHEYVVNNKPYRPQVETLFGNGMHLPADQLKYEDQPRGTDGPEFFVESTDAPVEQLDSDVTGSDVPSWNPCRGRNDGTYADDDDCTRYFHCSNGYPYRMTCSAGTVWNDQLKGCSFTYHTDVYQPYRVFPKVSRDMYQPYRVFPEDSRAAPKQVALEDPTTTTTLGPPVDEVQCYTCHDSSPYCKDHVSKSNYVALSKCRSKCFLRLDGGKMFRGCFDGWKGTLIKTDYEGCRLQYYINKFVEWCFCSSDRCNGASMPTIAQLDPEYDRDVQIVHSFDEVSVGTLQPRPVPDSVGKVIAEMCYGMEDGVYTDPYDCTRFVHCLAGFTHRRLCPPGTVWHDRRQSCDHPRATDNGCKPNVADRYPNPGRFAAPPVGYGKNYGEQPLNDPRARDHAESDRRDSDSKFREWDLKNGDLELDEEDFIRAFDKLKDNPKALEDVIHGM